MPPKLVYTGSRFFSGAKPTVPALGGPASKTARMAAYRVMKNRKDAGQRVDKRRENRKNRKGREKKRKV